MNETGMGMHGNNFQAGASSGSFNKNMEQQTMFQNIVSHGPEMYNP